MHFLYVDVTSGLTIGLLNSEFSWIEYSDINEKKPSEIIHLAVYDLLKRHNVDKKKLQYFFSAGPGSYTGMRLGEGMAQILEWEKESVYSFHQFEVPRLLGIEKGYWITNAFKGQVFIYSWDNGSSNIELINNADYKILDAKNGFTLAHDVEAYSMLQTSKDLIKENSQKFFREIFEQKMRKAPYYFRTLDEEFK